MSNNSELDIDKNELIRYICEDAKVEYSNCSQTNSGTEISVRITNNIIFNFIAHDNTYLLMISKESSNGSDILANKFKALNKEDYIKIYDRFFYDDSKLEIELKKMIRGDKLDKVIDD